MGLDSVELVIAFEEEFGIHIDDAEAANFTTPKHVADYVYHKVRTSLTDPCFSQRGFYKIRSALIQSFNLDRHEINPETRFKDLFGSETKEKWVLLQKQLGVKDLPRLHRRPTYIVATVLLLPGLIVIPLFFIGWPIQVVLLFYACLSIAINSATWNTGSVIPKTYQCVGSLIPFIDCEKTTIWSAETILERVVAVTSKQLGVPIEEIHENSHFVYDLGMD